MNFQRLALGDRLIETETQKRKMLLGAYLICMYLGIDAFFFLVSLLNVEGTPITLFLGTAISFLCLWLIRRGKIDTALYLHLIRSNAFAFYFSFIDEEPYQTATYIYFIPAALGALAVFGYRERWKGIGFAFLSFVLFLIAHFETEQFSFNKPHFYFVVNFLIALLIGFLILLFFDWLVLRSEEKVMSQNNQLIKANTELDRFVYSVSHDLRAPLSSILGLVNIYRYSEDIQQKDEIIDHIQHRAVKLDEFIREILSYSHNARVDLQPGKTDLHPLIEEVMESLRFTRGFSEISMQLDFPSDTQLVTDPHRFKVILHNLLSNAIKYQDRKKSSAFVRIGFTRDDRQYRLTFEDNGIGIKPEFLSKIFTMFFRANDEVEGSGLGLYIVKETVDKMGGKVELESSYAEGTTIRVLLPVIG